MEKTICEMFAGAGGFRCGLNSIRTLEDIYKPEKWKTAWFNQWEPADKTVQWAHGCYIHRFGTCLDENGNDTTNQDISKVDKRCVPDHNLLVGGFPCQDYSVASSLASSKGLEGKKGVLWWDVRDMLEKKGAPFVLLENVDRLLKSPARQRGRDFGIILACFRDLGYTVEWRAINAAEYGYQQRRRRTFIFAYKNDTAYAGHLNDKALSDVLLKDGFFAGCFPVESCDGMAKVAELPGTIGEVSDSFLFTFENTGIMTDGAVYTMRTAPCYEGAYITLGDILEDRPVDKSLFVSDSRLYYTEPGTDHSDESQERLPEESRRTWQYIKGAKRIPRTAANGHAYLYTEGAMPMVDEWDKPARTMLTSEGSFNRSTHLVRDRQTGQIRRLSPVEMERIQGFPSDWTKECLADGKVIEMPAARRRFLMGNALVVDLVRQMEPSLSRIFDMEK